MIFVHFEKLNQKLWATFFYFATYFRKNSFESMSPNVVVLIKPFRLTIMYFTLVGLLYLRLIATNMCKYFTDNLFASINTIGYETWW